MVSIRREEKNRRGGEGREGKEKGEGNVTETKEPVRNPVENVIGKEG